MAGRTAAIEGGGRQWRNRAPGRPNAAAKRWQQEADFNDRKKVSIGASFLVLASLTASLLVLPLVLPPLPPPPTSLLLWLPVCLLALLVVLLAFMPTDVRSVASSYYL